MNMRVFRKGGDTERLLVTLAALMFFTPPMIKGQSSVGREFSVTFPPMVQDDERGICAIIINARQTTNVIISAVGFDIEEVVTSQAPFQFDVICSQRTQDGVESKVHYVTSEKDISVTAINKGDVVDREIDVTQVYPKDSNNTEFYLSIFNEYPYGDIPENCGSNDNTAGYYVVSAYEDETYVEVYRPTGYELIATITLNRYESFTNTTTIADRFYDFSGYYIKSNKPVTVSAGNVCANNAGGSNLDHAGVTWSYMPPIQALSSGRHISYRMRSSYDYTIMVLSIEDATTISIDGSEYKTDRGEKVNEKFEDSWVLVTCDKPCLVFQVNCDCSIEGIFAVHVPPVSAYNTFVKFSSLSDVSGFTDEIIIVIPSNDIEAIVLGGLNTNYDWECKSLGQVYACALHTYMKSSSVDVATISSTDENVKFSAFTYGEYSSSISSGRGFGYNLGYRALNDSVISALPNQTAPSGHTSLLHYKVSQRAKFTSSEGAGFTQDCTNTYDHKLQRITQDMLPIVKDRIGSQLCTEMTVNDLEMDALSTLLGTETDTGVTSLLWTLTFSGSQTIGSAEICAAEVASFLSDHNNWIQPIIPDEPGCPGVLFLDDQFNTTDSKWICQTASTKESHFHDDSRLASTLEYGITFSGNLQPLGGGEIMTKQCLDQQVGFFRESTANQVQKTNALIGTELCQGKASSLTTRSAVLVSEQNNKVSAFQDVVLYALESLTFDEMHACADEVSAYLQSHDNWQQPIIGTPPGCPALVFSPPEFIEDEQRWIC